MNVQETSPKTPDEFLRWNQGRQGKREFVHGKVVELMINATRNHANLANRLLFTLTSQLGLDGYVIGSADFGIRTADGIRCPDVFVERAGGDPKGLASNEPLLLAEILSPSTMHDDFGRKASDYLALPALAHYLILSQDEARVWLWSRDDEGAFGEPAIHDDPSRPVELTGLGATLDLAALYKGIAERPS